MHSISLDNFDCSYTDDGGIKILWMENDYFPKSI